MTTGSKRDIEIENYPPLQTVITSPFKEHYDNLFLILSFMSLNV